ncbi:intermediate conductance calcium-activated potassium channel protein 4 [Gastrophryne carolinensis]
MGRSGWPLFTTCLPASPGKSTHRAAGGGGDNMPTKELTEISILTTQRRKVDLLREPPSENLRKLKRRKVLVEQKKRLSVWILVLALLGIVLMVVHTEMLARAVCKWFVYLFLIKCSITTSTIILLILIIAFHVKEIQLFMNDNSLVDWRIALNAKKLAWILLEIAVCSIHPFPFERMCQASEGRDPPLDSDPMAFLSTLEVFLSVLMFLRVYLIPRTLLLCSNVLVDASYRSIGSLNKIKFQYPFVMKILMNTCPGRVLLTLTISLWVTSSWTLSVCERELGPDVGKMKETMWLIPITFLTIGYGDMVPQTVCGKMVCLFTGVMGVGCTALIVAVAAQKLEFTKAEKHVHNFMLDIHYTKRIKCAAANVLREAWLLHKYTKLGDSTRIRQHQRKLLSAIHMFRCRRIKQKNLKDQMNAMVDVSKIQIILTDLDYNFTSSHQDLEKRIDQLDKKLDDLSHLIMAALEPPQLSH